MGPGLCPNCLQRLSADDTRRHIVKVGVVFGKVNAATCNHFFAKCQLFLIIASGYFCRLLITFANSSDPNQNVVPDLDLNRLTL